MIGLVTEARRRTAQRSIRGSFRNEDGAIDLASIMVGIIVIGLIGGVIAATVFAVIPWSQDNAAKQQLNSIVQAENAYIGLSSASPSPLPSGYAPNSFTDSPGLANASLLVTGPSYCAVSTNGGKGYQGYSASGSGNIFTVTDQNSNPILFTGTLPSACQSIATAATAGSSPSPSATASYTDPNPTQLVMTYKCDTAVGNAAPPLAGSINGTATWSDGGSTTYSPSGSINPRNFAAGVTYTFTFTGTFTSMNSLTNSYTTAAEPCLRSVDHWGLNTGTTNATNAFNNNTNLTGVPAHIPSTINSMLGMFNGAKSLNDPNISQWDISNVTDISSMFYQASAFNQPLNNWNTSNVTTLYRTFTNSAFNQPLNNWNTSKVQSMDTTFDTTPFNQDISSWDTSKVQSMKYMFAFDSAFNQPLNTWNTVLVTDMQFMFYKDTSFNQPLNNWNVSKVANMDYMFYTDSLFVQDVHTWNTAALGSAANWAPKATFPAAYAPAKVTLY